jgi:hypothetical protein
MMANTYANQVQRYIFYLIFVLFKRFSFIGSPKPRPPKTLQRYTNILNISFFSVTFAAQDKTSAPSPESALVCCFIRYFAQQKNLFYPCCIGEMGISKNDVVATSV